MSDSHEKGFPLSLNSESRTTKQSILYWFAISLVTLPILFVVIGIIVRWALMLGA
jgi:uncharacterized membrane protein YhdT